MPMTLSSLYGSPNSRLYDYYGAGTPFSSSLYIVNVRLPFTDPGQASQLWDVTCSGGRVCDVSPHTGGRRGGWRFVRIDAKGGLLLPSLCHPHIHLDKCFILDKCDPLISGTFDEAMKVTAKAKETFRTEGLEMYQRARKLVSESVECGVTSMRAHVEVDTTVGFACLDMAVKLAKEWQQNCDVQVAAFMQEPLFVKRGDTTPGPNYEFLQDATYRQGVYTIGSAPYVEPSLDQAKRNIDLVLQLAQAFKRHVDFHLDYNINPNTEPLIYYVIEQVRKTRWGGTVEALTDETVKPKMHITLGHCTRLCLFTPAQWGNLKEAIGALPISIVGLPQSDMYMMGRDQSKGLGPPRSTLRVPQIARDYGIRIAMGVNNVMNAFTPQGSLDPLSLATLGVGLFQTATPSDLKVLLESVTLTAKRALGELENNFARHSDVVPSKSDPADFVLLHNSQSLQHAILNPSYDRTTIRAGKIVARRVTRRWNEIEDVDEVTEKVVHPPWHALVRWRYVFCPPLFVYHWWFGRVIPAPRWEPPRLPGKFPRLHRRGSSNGSVMERL